MANKLIIKPENKLVIKLKNNLETKPENKLVIKLKNNLETKPENKLVIKLKNNFETKPENKLTIKDEINIFDYDKQYIISQFFNNVKGINICTINQNEKHCGKIGHWLENKMGVKHNSKNEPDINGYEMKIESNKTTLGDFSASEYAFSEKNKRNTINCLNNWSDDIKIIRNEFIHYFGNSNIKKNNRYSWSGISVPTYNNWNTNGQTLLISENNDIIIYYSFDKDLRKIKYSFPKYLHNNNIVIALWKNEKLKNHINNKFNNKGFFICKIIDNKFEHICFGKPFDYEYFIKCIKNKKIIFDSGMYEGNPRNYSQFRGSLFWDELIYLHI
jgi:hypothetical protein